MDNCSCTDSVHSALVIWTDRIDDSNAFRWPAVLEIPWNMANRLASPGAVCHEDCSFQPSSPLLNRCTQRLRLRVGRDGALSFCL
jgi:hypothetical protein